MTYRNAESRLPPRLIPLSEANRRSMRAFGYAAVAFGGMGFAIGTMLGMAL